MTHYTQDPERVPRRYRESLEIVRPRISAARGALPVLEVEPMPGRTSDEAGLEEPGLGERGTVPEPEIAPSPQPVDAGRRVEPPLPPASEALPPDTDPRALEIAELERELAARREELKTLISQSSFDSSQIALDPRLRELAEIVPRLQAELEALRGELEP